MYCITVNVCSYAHIDGLMKITCFDMVLLGKMEHLEQAVNRTYFFTIHLSNEFLTLHILITCAF